MIPQNQAWIGIAMIVVGSSLAIGGFVFLLASEHRPTRPEEAPAASTTPAPQVIIPAVDPPERVPSSSQQVTSRSPTPHTPPPNPGVELIEPLSSVEKGRKFEDWVVQHFRRDLFTIKEWRGDKFVAGISAESSTYPDLEIEFRLRDVRQQFAVECKWRAQWETGDKPYLTWATDRQIVNYQNFARSRAIPVFVVIGLGGQPDSPSEVFILPLDKIRFSNVTQEYLDRYRRKTGADRKFYFDPKVPELR